MDFVAIDFETASGNASSACQLAVVTVQDSEIRSEDCWMIRPPSSYFSPRNIAIHGIRPKDVKDAPTMEQVWGELAQTLHGRVVLAHNARFDIGVLVNSLAAYNIASPRLEFSCTRMLARGVWPGRSRYGLKPLGNWLGIDFNHHDALEDARCCAKIALAASQAAKEPTLKSLEKALSLTRGSCQDGRIISPKLLGRGRERIGVGRISTDRWGFPTVSRSNKPAGVDPQLIMAAAADSKPLLGKKIVLLGPLRGLSLEESTELVAGLGGQFHAKIGLDTDYVVACGTSLQSAGNIVCEAIAEAAADGSQSEAGIRVLSERQFRALLPGGKATAWH